MYITNQTKSISVNTTSLTSIEIVPLELSDKNDEIGPEACAIYAYGKGDKSYLLGVYTNKERATLEIKDIQLAMEESRKVYQMY